MSAQTAATRSTQPSSRLYDIPALENDGSNFQTWKFRIQTVLEMRELLGYIDGSVTDPGASEVVKHAEYLQQDKAARAQLTLTLSDEPLSSVLYAKTAKETWDKLHARYEGTGKQTIAFLIGELFRGTLSDEMPLETQLNAMRQKAFILASLGQALDDSLVAVAMVLSLPPSYSVLRTILMSTSSKLDTDTVVNSGLTEEKSRQNSTAVVALYAKARAQSKSKSRRDEKKKKKFQE